jgi:F0F1-type ATP synthase alpha subunit
MLSKNLLRNVPVNKVKEFEKDFLEFLTTNTEQLLDALKAGKLTDEITDNQTVAKFQQNITNIVRISESGDFTIHFSSLTIIKWQI